MTRETSRRGFLAACAGGLAGLAGCSRTGEGLVDSSLEHREPRRERAEDPIVVAFYPDQDLVTVTGFMYYGSSSCDRIELKEATYDSDAAELTVQIGSGEQRSLVDRFLTRGCTADMAGDRYRAEFQFAGELPARVTVVEEGLERGPQERTVDREEQEERCTTDHPEGSTEAETAHWTCPEKYVAANVSVDADESG